MKKRTQIIGTGLVMILRLFVCRVAVSFVGRGLLGDPIELPPSSSPGVSGDDVQPIRAHVFFLDLDFSFTRLGSQHLSCHPVFCKKTSFSTEKIEFMVVSCAGSEQSNMIQHWHQSPLLVFSGWKPPKGQDVTTWLQMFIFRKETQSYWVGHSISHVGHLFIVPPVCRNFDAFWNSINAFNITSFWSSLAT